MLTLIRLLLQEQADLGLNCLLRIMVQDISGFTKLMVQTSMTFLRVKVRFFSYLLCVLGAQKNHLIQMVLLSTHNIFFC